MQGYALNASDSVPPHGVYVLDLSHKSIRQVASIAGYDWDLSLTPDGKQLLLGQGAALPPQGQPQPPGLISTRTAYGGPLHVIYASHVYAVTQVRAISTKMLLFVLGGRFVSGEQSGLWRINMNGNDLRQLTKDGKFLSDQHTIRSDISCDGRLYAVASYMSNPGGNTGQTRILYGSLHGGPVTAVDTIDVSDNAEVVGWTGL
jgi:Tol biopolymer transport system component